MKKPHETDMLNPDMGSKQLPGVNPPTEKRLVMKGVAGGEIKMEKRPRSCGKLKRRILKAKRGAVV